METLIYIFAVVCAVWVIYNVWAVNTKLSTGSKVIWTVFALLFNILTAVVYFFTNKK